MHPSTHVHVLPPTPPQLNFTWSPGGHHPATEPRATTGRAGRRARVRERARAKKRARDVPRGAGGVGVSPTMEGASVATDGVVAPHQQRGKRLQGCASNDKHGQQEMGACRLRRLRPPFMCARHRTDIFSGPMSALRTVYLRKKSEICALSLRMWYCMKRTCNKLLTFAALPSSLHILVAIPSSRGAH